MLEDLEKSKTFFEKDVYFELLKKKLHPKLLQFHSAWYSSNIMSLAVLGKGMI